MKNIKTTLLLLTFLSPLHSMDENNSVPPKNFITSKEKGKCADITPWDQPNKIITNSGNRTNDFSDATKESTPEQISHIYWYQGWDLQGDKIEKSLSAESFCNLIYINFSYSKIDSIKWVGNFKKVRILNLGYNEINVIPEDIKNLVKLHTFLINHNQVKDPSPLFPLLDKLSILHIRKNPVEASGYDEETIKKEYHKNPKKEEQFLKNFQEIKKSKRN